MLEKTKTLVLLCFSLALTLPVKGHCQPDKAQSEVIEGRLILEQRGDTQRLIVHGRNARAYLPEGPLLEELKKLRVALGEKNLVVLTGTLDGNYTISCDRINDYGSDEKGTPEVKTAITCYRYYAFRVEKIVSSSVSPETISPPERDSQQENKALKMISREELTPPVYGEIAGKIKKINLRSPVKTLEIANSDAQSELKTITLIIGTRTRIAKNTGSGEPTVMFAEQLRPGQQVTATYSRSETKTEGLFITVTKE
ncbi:MAG TPA: hypothetical protein P5110_00915 [Candidatus Omnitrophota bacterium]|nr:hypothetical protein [Candidatus Omnitrophota bacterium]